MKRNKKIAIASLSVCLAAALAIGTTMAFLTDSEEAVNRFSVGDLDITLDEPNWDEDDGRDLIPGDSVEKDPTITAVTGDSYVRIVMEIQDKNGAAITNEDRLDLILQTIYYDSGKDGKPLITQGESYSLDDLEKMKLERINGDFTQDKEKSTASGEYYYNYSKVMKQGESAKLFTDIVVPIDWDREELELLGEYSIVIQAQAIQADNFSNAKEAFDALDGEIEKGTIDKNYATVGGVTVKS